MKKRISSKHRIDFEEVNIDVSKLSEEHLYRIAEITEEEIRKALDEVLGPRMLKYLLMVDVNVEGDQLNVVVDLAVDSHIVRAISLESVIDRAIKRGLDKAAAYIRELAKELRREDKEVQQGSDINA